MAFGSLSDSDVGGDLAEINMIPLIDVMLVLLVIFIVTAPMLTHAFTVDLPKASSDAQPDPAGQRAGRYRRPEPVYWNGEPVDAPALAERMQAAAARVPQPELHLRAEAATPYEKVAQVMSEAARHGLTRIGFVTDPSMNR